MLGSGLPGLGRGRRRRAKGAACRGGGQPLQSRCPGRFGNCTIRRRCSCCFCSIGVGGQGWRSGCRVFLAAGCWRGARGACALVVEVGGEVARVACAAVEATLGDQVVRDLGQCRGAPWPPLCCGRRLRVEPRWPPSTVRWRLAYVPSGTSGGRVARLAGTRGRCIGSRPALRLGGTFAGGAARWKEAGCDAAVFSRRHRPRREHRTLCGCLLAAYARPRGRLLPQRCAGGRLAGKAPFGGESTRSHEVLRRLRPRRHRGASGIPGGVSPVAPIDWL
mmetsp:Transcript_123791/g.396218  ORF Transcript_123791/g.396218 Transcript_123791/m.396218 type:complete len:277 (+) Transcript_123791:1799-2629(+)